jgi:hypothetical protein
VKKMISNTALQMVSGNVKGSWAIKDALNQALELARQLYIDEMTAWADTFMPYRTGRLHDAVVALIESSSTRRLRLGGGGIYYAGYVDAMNPPINWTNPDTVYHWYEKMTKHAEVIVPRVIRAAIKQVGLNVLTGSSAAALEGEILVD